MTDDRVWLSKARRKGLADIMDGTILGPRCGDDRVDVLTQEGRCELGAHARKAEVLTFDLGGVGFGLQAFFTTFSKEDIVSKSKDEPESDQGVADTL